MSGETTTKSIRTAGDMVTVQAAIDRVDEVAVDCERRWGVDRLRRLVPQDMAEAFMRQAEKFNTAIWEGTPVDVVEQAERMIAAWQTLDAAASASGARTVAKDCWEVPCTIDGVSGVLAVCKSREDALAVQADGRHLHVVTLDAVARLIEQQPTLCSVFRTFEDAAVIDVRKKCNEKPIDDDTKEVLDLLMAG